ncbi:MAG: class I SAM-dependent methyltransferase [Acidobacteria bacterium]|nr:class I SAM-dependent methyltransferase [Acidobacteriota bacterium]
MASLRRRAKELGKQAFRRLFESGQRLGMDVLPHHFYSEVPDIAMLRRSDEWKQPRTMIGVTGAGIAEQFAFVESCCTAEMIDVLGGARIHAEACAKNGEPGFGAVESDFLYAFMRRHRPPRVMQVGCGVSTAIMLRAARDGEFECAITCVEPFPTRFLEEAERQGRIRLLRQGAEQAPLETLTGLGSGDLLFVDSTHTVKPGGEVNRIILEVLPRLASGAWVHFHDIRFPYDYPRRLLKNELFFGNESVLLHAFLIGNGRFQIAASLSMLHYADPARLQRSLPAYRPAENDCGLEAVAGHFPSSIYLEARSPDEAADCARR